MGRLVSFDLTSNWFDNNLIIYKKEFQLTD